MWKDKVRRTLDALALMRTVGPDVEELSGKSIPAQVLEILVGSAQGYRASDYYLLEMYRAKPRTRYMTRKQFDKLRRLWNPPAVGIIEFNKWIFGHYISALGLPTPQCYGIFEKSIGVTSEGTPLRSLEELRSLIERVAAPIAIKPIAGSHGNHVIVLEEFDEISGVVTRANQQKVHLNDLHDALVRQQFPWLLQAKVQQHDRIHALHPHSLNTSRVVTLLRSDGEVEILAAVLRIGVGTAEIDNTTGGGIVAPIDLDSGICSAAVSEARAGKFESHPDTGCPISGLSLPFWDQIKSTATRAHRLLPFARSLGWDIAIGQDGPVIIEVNGTWYMNHVQMTGKSLWETAFADGPCPS